MSQESKSKYDNMRTITSIRARIKIAVFYLRDLALLGLTYLIGDYLQQVLQWKLSVYALFQVTNLLVCLYMCLPSRNNPKRNNFNILWLYVMREKRRFMSPDFLFIRKKDDMTMPAEATHGRRESIG